MKRLGWAFIGERVELASIVEGDWVVLPRGVDAPMDVTDAEQGAGAGDLDLTASDDPEALCNCTFFRQFEVPVNELVWQCFPVKGGFGSVCVQVPGVVIHHVACFNSCGSCGTVTCHDYTSNANVAYPASQYQTSSAWLPCNPNSVCD